MFHYFSTIKRVFIVILLGSNSAVFAGVSEHVAREFQIKYTKSYVMPPSTELSNITYIVELITLGLISVALFFVTFSIISRRINAKKEFKKIKALRLSAEGKKIKLENVLSQALNVEEQLERSIINTQNELNEVAKRSSEVERSARNIKALEKATEEMAGSLSAKIEGMEERWFAELKGTQKKIEKLTLNMEALMNVSPADAKTENKNAVTAINKEISQTLDQVLQNSKALASKIDGYQENADLAFGKFTHTLGEFESQAQGELKKKASVVVDINTNKDKRAAEVKSALETAHLKEKELADFFSKFRHSDSA